MITFLVTFLDNLIDFGYIFLKDLCVVCIVWSFSVTSKGN